jgi:acylphosphatase
MTEKPTGQKTSRARVHATVHGHVQGVNFRYYTTRTARRLGLTGWVANRRGGTVETIAEGEQSEVEAFVDFLHRGSPAARVEEVDVKWESPRGQFEGFRVRYL